TLEIFPPAKEQFMATQIIIIFLKVSAVFAPRPSILRLPNASMLTRERCYDFLSHLVLKCPGIASFLVVTLGPNMLTAASIDQLGDDADLIGLLAHASLEHVLDAELSTHLTNIYRLSLVGEA